MATFGDFTFDQVDGVVPPLSTPSVADVDNPGLVPSTVTRPTDPEPATLTYLGWFENSPKAALYALTSAVLNAQDETGATLQVKVKRITVRSQVSLDADGIKVGHLVTLAAEVRAWA